MVEIFTVKQQFLSNVIRKIFLRFLSKTPIKNLNFNPKQRNSAQNRVMAF